MTAQHPTNPINDNDTLLRDAIAAAQAADNQRALKLLGTLVQRDPRNAAAWFLLARVVAEPERRRYCLERALAVNPTHAEARQMLNGDTLKPARPARMIGESESPTPAPSVATPSPTTTPAPTMESLESATGVESAPRIERGSSPMVGSEPSTERGSSPLNVRLAAAETRRTSQPRMIRETDPEVKWAGMASLMVEEAKVVPGAPKRPRVSEPFLMLKPVSLSDVPPLPAPTPAPVATAEQPKSDSRLEASAAQLLAAISGEAQQSARHESDTLRKRLLQAPAPDEALAGLPSQPLRLHSAIAAPQADGARRTQYLGALLLIGMIGFVLFAAFFALATMPSA